MWLSKLRTQIIPMWMRVRSLALLSGLRIRNCCELQHKFQLWLCYGCGVGRHLQFRFDPKLGTSKCCRCVKAKKKKKKRLMLPYYAVGNNSLQFILVLLNFNLNYRDKTAITVTWLRSHQH